MSKIDMDKVLMNVRTINVDGVDYKVQKIAPRPALELRRQWNAEGGVDELLMFELLLEHMVVDPKVRLDDFEDVVILEELCMKVYDYQYKTKGK